MDSETDGREEKKTHIWIWLIIIVAFENRHGGENKAFLTPYQGQNTISTKHWWNMNPKAVSSSCNSFPNTEKVKVHRIQGKLMIKLTDETMELESINGIE